MKAILLFIFLSGCGLNESLVNSIGEQAKDVIDKAKSQGGQKGIQTLNDEIEDLEEKIDKKESEYRRLKNRIDDKEEELDEKQDELDDVEKRLREIEDRLNEGGLTPEEVKALKDERDRLQGEKTTLEQEKQRLQDQINGLNTDKEQLEAERDQAKADLEAVKEARDDLQRQLDEALSGKRSAENRASRERDRANRERDRANRAEDCWKTNICGRSRDIKNAILKKQGETDCEKVKVCELWGITSLDLSGSYSYGDTGAPKNSPHCGNNTLVFNKEDFRDFKNLENLNLSGVCLFKKREGAGVELKTKAGIFEYLLKIRRIDLRQTGVGSLPSNFFTDNNLRTLEDGGVKVTNFVYCGEPEPPFKRKLTGYAHTPWIKGLVSHTFFYVDGMRESDKEGIKNAHCY